MARIRLFQWCVLKSTKDFIPFCKDTSEFYLEEINLYTENAWNKKLPDSTIYFDFILFLGSMVQYDCDTRDYFAYKYKNIYPMPDQTPRGGSMDSDLADEVSNLLKAIITNRETVLKNYYQGSTEFTYGELKLQTLLELVNRSKMKFANENNFIDCGSGISNLQAGVAITQSVNSSIGVEINPLIGSAGKLYLHSFYLLARFANYSFSPTIHIIGDFNNNALDNLYNAKASIFFVNNFLLNDNTTLKLLDKISDTELSTTGIILTLNIGVGLRKFDYFANRKFEKQKFTLKDCVSWTKLYMMCFIVVIINSYFYQMFFANNSVFGTLTGQKSKNKNKDEIAGTTVKKRDNLIPKEKHKGKRKTKDKGSANHRTDGTDTSARASKNLPKCTVPVSLKGNDKIVIKKRTKEKTKEKSKEVGKETVKEVLKDKTNKEEDSNNNIKLKTSKTLGNDVEPITKIVGTKTQVPEVKPSPSIETNAKMKMEMKVTVPELKQMLKTCGDCKSGLLTYDLARSILIKAMEATKEYFKAEPLKRDGVGLKYLTPNEVQFILHRVTDILEQESVVLEITVPPEGMVVLSDLHGSLVDLLYNFKTYGIPPKKMYLFLGDYVDKGEDEVPLMFLLFCLKATYPDKMLLLRGNHEIVDMNRQKKFPAHCKEFFGDVAYFRMLNYVMERLPICAFVNDSLLCVHGGVSQWMKSREQLKAIKRPIKLNLDLVTRLVISDMLWSDPLNDNFDDTATFMFSPTLRGCGWAFSDIGLEAILKKLKLKKLLRGHQVCELGFNVDFQDTCITVHTKSMKKNNAKSGVVILTNSENQTNTCPIIDTQNYYVKMSNANIINILDILITSFNGTKEDNYNEKVFSSTCKHCSSTNYFKEISDSRRTLVTHTQLNKFLGTLAYKKLYKEETGRILNTANQKLVQVQIKRFPIYLDFLACPDDQFLRDIDLIANEEMDIYAKLKSIVKEKGEVVKCLNPKYDVLPMLNLLERVTKRKFNFTADESDVSEGSGESSSSHSKTLTSDTEE
uniref:Multifunctional fusion protein n=1 Tax=Parastrongyloides trichosuri TaxID=131310 RepID=A0A0N4Z2Q9_PARTI